MISIPQMASVKQIWAFTLQADFNRRQDIFPLYRANPLVESSQLFAAFQDYP
jgi:hypothetical protein